MSEAIFVNGYLRACIYDLSRNDYLFVPNKANDIIEKINFKKKSEIVLSDLEYKWLDIFLLKELFFLVPKKAAKNFPKLNLDWESPSLITSSSVEYSSNFQRSLDLLDELICKQITIFCDSEEYIEEIANKHLCVTNFQNVDFLIKGKNKSIDINCYKEQFNVINDISFLNKRKENNNFFSPFLVVNIDFFSESQKFNVYFNRKIHIDNNGNILNNYKSQEVYGNINSISDLNQFIDDISILYEWNVNKDKIDICKDCELRYMCLDDRKPIKKNINDTYFNNLECRYNPYIAKWEGEEGYKTLAECGVISDENGFYIDHDKIAEINKALWED